ncbi:putative glycoside hydrolase/deacetylase, beta/alpha-barrel [Septoria linicola]|nr:putative glycoside hydrolase/deacetylase, beta/alpha-barrel [Septoria linicola]
MSSQFLDNQPDIYHYDRDFQGYGEHGLQGLTWPNNAKIAVSFVINYEEVPYWIDRADEKDKPDAKGLLMV